LRVSCKSDYTVVLQNLDLNASKIYKLIFFFYHSIYSYSQKQFFSYKLNYIAPVGFRYLNPTYKIGDRTIDHLTISHCTYFTR